MERIHEAKSGYRWRGYNLVGEALDLELIRGSSEIDQLWEAEMSRLYGQQLDFAALSNLARRSSDWARNALARAYEWALGSSPRQKTGIKLITVYSLKGIVSGAQRVQKEHPGVDIDYVELVQNRLAKMSQYLLEKKHIPKEGENWNLIQIVNTLTYKTGLLMVAGELIVPGDNKPEDIYVDPEDEVVRKHTAELVRQAVIDGLSDRAGLVISSRFGLEDKAKMTREEIAQKLGITYERVRQIEALTLRKLRKLTVLRSLQGHEDQPSQLQLLFNSYVNAMHMGDYQKASSYAKKVVDYYLALLSMVRNLGEGIKDVEDLMEKAKDRENFPMGKNRYVDELRYYFRMQEKAALLTSRVEDPSV